MRALLALVGIAAVVVAILLNGGAAPSVDANLATVSVGTTNKTIEVPTVTTTEKTITVPTVKMNKPGDVAANSAQ